MLLFAAVAFVSVLGEACPTAPASGGAPHTWVVRLRCVGMAAASHDIRLRGSTLVLLNVPRRKDSEGEPLIV